MLKSLTIFGARWDVCRIVSTVIHISLENKFGQHPIAKLKQGVFKVTHKHGSRPIQGTHSCGSTYFCLLARITLLYFHQSDCLPQLITMQVLVARRPRLVLVCLCCGWGYPHLSFCTLLLLLGYHFFFHQLLVVFYSVLSVLRGCCCLVDEIQRNFPSRMRSLKQSTAF